MEVRTLFFDSYAFFEILNKNVAYSGLLDGIIAMTTKLNLMELYYGILKDYGKISADEVFERFSEFVVEIDDETLKDAMQFRLQNREKKLSYIDAVGYMLALKRNVKFLTGDMQFKEMPNVEFVK